MTRDEPSTQRYYDDFSSHYDDGRDRGYHALIDRIEAGLVAEHAPGARVLEVGCGTGLLLSRIAPIASRAVGVDLSPGMIARARDRGLNVVRGSAVALPFADASFDVVYSFKVLAHVPDIDTALREAVRVTRPGGVMLLEFYNPWSLRYVARKIAGARQIGRSHTEADVETRWDSPVAIRRRIPVGATLTEFHGVRVWTPAAFMHRWPLVGPRLGRWEHRASRHPIGILGGFLVAVVRRDGGARDGDARR